MDFHSFSLQHRHLTPGWRANKLSTMVCKFWTLELQFLVSQSQWKISSPVDSIIDRQYHFKCMYQAKIDTSERSSWMINAFDWVSLAWCTLNALRIMKHKRWLIPYNLKGKKMQNQNTMMKDGGKVWSPLHSAMGNNMSVPHGRVVQCWFTMNRLISCFLDRHGHVDNSHWNSFI